MVIDAVLPLTRGDASRARILRVSLDKFFRDLGTCWVVTPDADVSIITEQYAGGQYRVIPESLVVPEITSYNKLRRLVGRKPVYGWYVQQLIKLAAADVVKTEFYLTLDADNICVRPIRYDDLVKGGKAIGVRYDHPPRSENYDRAAKILRLPRSTWTHPVTPSIFSRTAVQMMQHHLTRLIPKPLKFLPGIRNWRGYLWLNLPWTEYTLYATFVSGLGLYDRFHFKDDYYRLYSNSVWNREQFVDWDPAKSFVPQTDHYFMVVQSATDIAPAAVWEKVGPYLHPTEPGTIPGQGPTELRDDTSPQGS